MNESAFLIAYDTASVHGYDSFLHHIHDLITVSHHDHRGSLLIDKIQQSHDLNGIVMIQISRGLVRQNNGRLSRQRPCNGNPLLLSP